MTADAEAASTTVVQRLAELAASVRRDGLPDALREDVARRVLDLVGNSLAASGEPSRRRRR